MSEEPAVYRVDATRLERAREDALPEHLDYRDEGCDLFDRCLACPLPRCRYDVPGGIRTIRNAVRDQGIRRCRDAAVPIDEIAERFEVSRRTVFRVLAATRASGAPANGHELHRNGASDA
jgi:hypothetical protein